MDRDKFIEMVSQFRPDLLEGKDTEKLTDTEIETMARQALELPKKEQKPVSTEKPASTGITADDLEKILSRVVQSSAPPAFDMNQIKEVITTTAKQELDANRISAEIKKVTDEIQQRAACARLLDNMLSESGLPEMARQRIKPVFEGQVFEKEALQSLINDEKDYLAKMDVPGFPKDHDNQIHVKMGISPLEKCQIALHKAFDISHDDFKAKKTDLNDMRVSQSAIDAYEEIDAFRSLREAYTAYTGDSDVTGRFNPANLISDLRASQDVTTSTFTYALGNTLYRRLIKGYMLPAFQEDLLISERKSVKDFRLQEAIKTGYMDNIPEVAQTGAYATLDMFTDERSTYKLRKFGGKLPISWETIINDDIGMVRRMVDGLGRAMRRTYAEFVWDFVVKNSTVTDGTNWFTSDHGNLGASAMSFATVQTAYLALANMTEKDSGKKIGLLDDPGNKPTLVYPVGLSPTAHKIVNQDKYFDSNDLTTETLNFMFGRINGAMISLLSDANDWYLLMNPAYVSMVEMGFLNGQQQPQVLMADNPSTGAMWTNDMIEYKIKHVYGGTATDYVGGYKAVVA